MGRESVVLTLVEKKTDYYIAIKIPVNNSVSVKTAVEVLREEYGEDKSSEIFKTITADNGSESEDFKSLEEWCSNLLCSSVFILGKSSERAHNILFCRYLPNGVSIENNTDEQIMWFADEINDIPMRQLCYSTPAELFDEFLIRCIQLSKYM